MAFVDYDAGINTIFAQTGTISITIVSHQIQIKTAASLVVTWALTLIQIKINNHCFILFIFVQFADACRTGVRPYIHGA